MIKFTLIVLLSTFLKPTDSPLTSTGFYKAYLDVPLVRLAADSGELTPALVEYLRDASTPVDVKMAVVNALGWSFDGKNRVEPFLDMAYADAEGRVNLDALSGEDLLVLGYMQAMDDYFQPEKALGFLFMARRKLPKSYTANMIFALVRAQTVFDLSWCEVWRSAEDVIQNKKLKMDMRPEANEIILEYMRLYQDSCE